LLSLTLLISTKAFAQLDTVRAIKKVHSDASKMVEAFLLEEYDSFLTYVHPLIIQQSGGSGKLKRSFRAGIAPNASIVSSVVEPPKKIIFLDSTWQCAFVNHQLMNMSGNEYTITGYIIGISYNEGGKWHFLSVSGNSLKFMQNIVPEISSELQVSRQTKPKLVKY